MRRQLLITFCQQCGTPLVRTASGAVCPGGCGRIQPLSYDVHSGPYPEAKRVIGTHTYTIAGEGGTWRTAIARPILRSWASRR